MRFTTIDLLTIAGKEAIAITTNGTVKPDGSANMGRGNALAVAARFPAIAAKLGHLIQTRGNHVHDLGSNIFSFPVEETWLSQAELRLVKRSAQELLALVEARGIDRITLPLPGCGKGGLDRTEVIAVLEQIFDDRFLVTQQPNNPPGSISVKDSPADLKKQSGC
ncbi:MAG: ADP-ribose-binding protein [Desulfuromonas thiophila]|jgi:hypothetical protein|nr:ADP-ribose-binding protein [Desulfuromonas thiophila]MDY0399025.1 ADP-ribose-binding protein [Desulfuromonas thiophila]